MSTKGYDRAIIVTGILGVLVSTYALYVEMEIEVTPGYKALCDIAERASCSKVLGSVYAKGFGVLPEESSFKIPNCIYGTIFFCIMIFLATFESLFVVRFQYLLSLMSIAGCVYLGYLLAFVLYDFCIVCVTSYVLNAVLLALVHKKMKFLSRKNK